MDDRETPQQRRATINDVAKLSGTSIATVSRVLNQSSYPVSAKTRKRVEDAARALQYAPNLLGSMLKSKNNRSLGIVIPSFQNPYFVQLTMGIENAAKARGYSTFVFSSQRDAQKERELIFQSLQLHLSGLMLSSISKEPDVLTAFLDSGAGAVIFEANFPLDPRAIDATSHMDENGYLATKHLLDLGHRDIVLLTTPLSKHNRKMVSKGFQNAMADNGLCVSPEDIIESSFEREMDDGLFEFEAGRELAQQLLHASRRYTAVVAVNDLVACGVVQQLTRCGVRVPGDISVIGIDDIPQCVMMTPTLSSVNQQSYQHGHAACMQLIDGLEKGAISLDQRCYCKPKVIKRESTAAP